MDLASRSIKYKNNNLLVTIAIQKCTKHNCFVPVRLVFFNESYYSTPLEIYCSLYVLLMMLLSFFPPKIINLIPSTIFYSIPFNSFLLLSVSFSPGRAGNSAAQRGVVTETAGVFWHECGLQVQSIR